jgi:hypothetical protein
MTSLNKKVRSVYSPDLSRTYDPSFHTFTLDFSNKESYESSKKFISNSHDLFVSAGFEGAMLRRVDAPYLFNHRSHDLLKVKEFQDAEFEILRIETPITGKDKGTALFICKVTSQNDPEASHLEFEASSLGSWEYREALYKNASSLIGKFATVKYFSLTKLGIPRFPKVVSIRDYE